MTVPVLECDLLVIGGGMAGMTAAAEAARRGQQVVVIEKSPQIGGAALVSNGYIWTCASVRQLAQFDDVLPLGRKVVEEYPNVIAWLRSREVELSAPKHYLLGHGYEIDIPSYVEGCRSSVLDAGGHVVVEAIVTSLHRDEHGAVDGARISQADGEVDVRAPATILATGGIQNDPSLRETFIGAGGAEMPVRAPGYSCGDGLALALGAGGVATQPSGGFYGHLVAAPAKFHSHEDFARLTPYHSDRSLLFGRDGQRICDESFGDAATALAMFHAGHRDGLLLWDERIEEDLRRVNTGVVLDGKVALASSRGADAASCGTFEDLASIARNWGFSSDRLVQSVENYNQQCRSFPEAMSPPRAYHWLPIDRAPFHLMRVKPAVTFAYGGIRVDENMQVLAPDEQPIPGLFAAGVDVGDVWRRGYAGGLAIALVLGLAAGTKASEMAA
jgi:succinate dehydrogenase/fumarate reductase flavoprotein subunit